MIDIHPRSDSDSHLQQSSQYPFREEITLNNFYGGAGRAELLTEIRDATSGGIPLLVLTGEEGSGKTMLCQKLASEPFGVPTVLFPRTVDSFEGVVRTIGTRIGLVSAAGATDAGLEGNEPTDVSLDTIIDHLASQSSQLLLIFDEAENIYLATLERIRKLLDRLTETEVRMSILFSGRKSFLENCEQLSICNFTNDQEMHFSLSPLGESDLVEYLAQCASQLESSDKDPLFTDEVLQNIYEVGKGNFRMTNILAEEAVKSQGDEESFTIALENVREEKGQDEDENGFDFRSLIEQYSGYLPWAGGVVCLLFLGVFFFSGDQTKETASEKTSGEQEVQIVVVKKKPETNVDKQTLPEPLKNQDAPQKTEVTESKKGEGQTEDKVADIEQSAKKEKSVQPVEEKKQEVPIKKEKIVALAPDVQLDRAANVAKEALREENRGSAENPIIVLHRSAETKKRPGAVISNKNTRQSNGVKLQQKQEPQNVIKIQPPNVVQEVVSSNAHFTIKQLYQKRIRAGAIWKSGEKNQLYTVQLMVLTSKNAEENLKKMLAQPRYRQEAGNFYIFNKKSSPPQIFVYYGEYPTIARARLAQNSLPQFLRDHKPYAISIKGAIGKLKR